MPTASNDLTISRLELAHDIAKEAMKARGSKAPMGGAMNSAQYLVGFLEAMATAHEKITELSS